jgi:hypothetical protein
MPDLPIFPEWTARAARAVQSRGLRRARFEKLDISKSKTKLTFNMTQTPNSPPKSPSPSAAGYPDPDKRRNVNTEGSLPRIKDSDLQPARHAKIGTGPRIEGPPGTL